MKIVFMGTPDFAVGALEHIIEAGHQVAAVVTQPDKPKGRSSKLQMSPVKSCALSHGIPVFQPVRIREEESVARLRTYRADVFVVAAFGQILSEEILVMPKFGCINIHASLLPKYRGASPIQWAIINGDKETGVTIMQMDKGVDTGDILLQRKVPVAFRETGDSLFDKLSQTGAELIVEALEKLPAGELIPRRQDGDRAVHVGMMKKSMGLLDWSMSAETLDCLVRGLISWPGAYTYFQDKTLKIWTEEPVAVAGEGGVLTGNRATEMKMEECAVPDGFPKGNIPPGTVVAVEKGAFYVQTGDGLLKVTEVQLEGRKRMPVKDFLMGYQLKAGQMLGK